MTISVMVVILNFLRGGRFMHKPVPYGTYPLVLRNYNTPNPRSGELLFNYEDMNLYVCNRANNNKITPVSKLIYDKSLNAAMDNANIIYATERMVDNIPDRGINSFYLIGRG